MGVNNDKILPGWHLQIIFKNPLRMMQFDEKKIKQHKEGNTSK